MTMQKGICEECKKEYEYDYNPKYPRKYCPDCSTKKKAEYKARPQKVFNEMMEGTPNSMGVKDEAKGPAQKKPRNDEYQSTIFNVNEKPHSYEFGKAGARHKIYYENVNELQEHIRMLKAEGLVPPDLEDIE